MNGENKNGGRLKVWIPLAASIGAAGAALASGQMPDWIVEEARRAAPYSLFLLGAVWVVYHPPQIARQAVRAQQDIAVSMAGIKDQLQIMSGQAGQLHEIKEILGEIQITQGAHSDRLGKIETRLYELRREDD